MYTFKIINKYFEKSNKLPFFLHALMLKQNLQYVEMSQFIRGGSSIFLFLFLFLLTLLRKRWTSSLGTQFTLYGMIHPFWLLFFPQIYHRSYLSNDQGHNLQGYDKFDDDV